MKLTDIEKRIATMGDSKSDGAWKNFVNKNNGVKYVGTRSDKPAYTEQHPAEKYLNLTLKKVMTNNPGAMREQTFKLLEQQLGNPND